MSPSLNQVRAEHRRVGGGREMEIAKLAVWVIEQGKGGGGRGVENCQAVCVLG